MMSLRYVSFLTWEGRCESRLVVPQDVNVIDS